MTIKRKTLWRSFGYFRPDFNRIAAAITLLLLSIGFNVLKPWPLAIIVDCVLGHKPLPVWARAMANWPKPILLAEFSAAIFFLHLVAAIFAAAQNLVSIQTGLRGLRRVRADILDHLQRFSFRALQSANLGDLIYRASWDSYSFQTLFQQGLMTVITASLSLLIMLVIMVRMDKPLTLAAFALAPMLVIVIRIYGRRMRERTATAQQADSLVTTLIQQTLALLPLIQSETRETVEANKFQRAASDAQTRRLAQHGSELSYGFAVALVFGLGTAVVTFIGAEETLSGKMTVGELFVFLSYLAQLYEPLNQLSHAGSTVAGATAGTNRVFEILDISPEVQDPDVPVPFPSQPDIAFDNVSFAYVKDRDVLRKVSFTLSPGETAAVVGPSGAGKTTLLHLLPRFFEPDGGAVKIGGIDVRQISLAELRRHIAFVFQEPIILPATIAENIACAKPEASSQEIAAAARAANAGDFIAKLPETYSTRIGEGGIRLSAGERQRISLARAFLKNAPIILLDEPTSALDAESESLIAESLERLLANRTALVVSHRPATITRLRRVIALQDGQIRLPPTHGDSPA